MCDADVSFVLRIFVKFELEDIHQHTIILPVYTHDTAGMGSGMPWYAEVQYHTDPALSLIG